MSSHKIDFGGAEIAKIVRSFHFNYHLTMTWTNENQVHPKPHMNCR